MKGPKPKPTQLKILTGNPGNRPLPKNEPMPTGRATRPDWLSPLAATIWSKYAPRLSALGLLTDFDEDSFGVWCSLMAEFQVDPASVSANRISRMEAIAGKFGLTPGDRARLKVGEVPKDESPADRYFGS